MNLKATNKTETNKYELEIEVPAEDFNKAIDEVFKTEGKKITIPGFRRGKAPKAFIEKYYGESVFFEAAVDRLYRPALMDAVEASGLEVISIGQADITEVSKANGVQMKVTVVVKPEITIEGYKGIEASKKKVEVTDEDVSAELAKVQDRNSRMVTVEDRAALTGDTAVIDFEGFCDGEAFEGGKGENFELALGSGQFIPGFEDQIVGHETGEEFEINVKFPEEYQAENLKGKDATFKIKLHEIKRKELPVLDDEFAKDVSEFDTLDEYKADLKAKTLERKRQNAEMDFKNAVVTEAIDRMEVTVPASMVDEKADEFLMNYSDSMGLPRGRVSRADLIKALGFTEESYAAMMRPVAERQVKADLLFDAVAKAEGLEATDEDKEEFYKRLAEDYGEDAEKIKGMIDEKLMVQDIVRRKAADILYDSAVKTEPKPEEEKPAEETSEEAPAGEPSAE